MRTLFICAKNHYTGRHNTISLSLERKHELRGVFGVVGNLARSLSVNEFNGNISFYFSEDVPERMKEFVSGDVEDAIHKNIDEIVYRDLRFYGSMLDFYYQTIEPQNSESRDKELSASQTEEKSDDEMEQISFRL